MAPTWAVPGLFSLRRICRIHLGLRPFTELTFMTVITAGLTNRFSSMSVGQWLVSLGFFSFSTFSPTAGCKCMSIVLPLCCMSLASCFSRMSTSFLLWDDFHYLVFLKFLGNVCSDMVILDFQLVFSVSMVITWCFIQSKPSNKFVHFAVIKRSSLFFSPVVSTFAVILPSLLEWFCLHFVDVYISMICGHWLFWCNLFELRIGDNRYRWAAFEFVWSWLDSC